MKQIPLVLVLAILLVNPEAWAAKVVLKNGSIFDGTLLRQDATSVTLRTSFGEITIQRWQISRLEGVESERTPAESRSESPRKDRPVEPPRAERPSAERTGEEHADERPAPTPDPSTDRTEVEHPAPVPVYDRRPEESAHRVAPIVEPSFYPKDGSPAEASTTEETSAGLDQDPSPDFEAALKRSLGKSGATWGIGFLIGVLLVYIVVSFALATVIAWGVAHMMSSVGEPSLLNALKVTGIQWGAGILVLVMFGVFLAAMGAGSDPSKLAVAATTACCALPVVCLVLIGINIGTVARVLDLGIGQSILFVIGQGIGGWAVDAVLRTAMMSMLTGTP